MMFRNGALVVISLMIASSLSAESRLASWSVETLPFTPFDCPQEGDQRNNLCLHGGDFEIETHWWTLDGQKVAPLTEWSDSAGVAHYYDPRNPELLVKVLDGCRLNGHFWVGIGGLTDQRVRVTVFDHRANVLREYENPPKTLFQPVLDHWAFPCEL